MFESIIRPSQPKREQDDPKEAHQDLKETKKTAVPQTLKKQWIFSTFLNTDTSQKSSQTPEDHKKDTRNSKTQSNDIQNRIKKNYTFSSKFWKTFQYPLAKIKKIQIWTNFKDPLPPHLRDPNNAPPKSKREG